MISDSIQRNCRNYSVREKKNRADFWSVHFFFVPLAEITNNNITMLKKMTFTALLLMAGTGLMAQGPAIARDAKLEAKIEKTLAKMTHLLR